MKRACECECECMCMCTIAYKSTYGHACLMLLYAQRAASLPGSGTSITLKRFSSHSRGKLSQRRTQYRRDRRSVRFIVLRARRETFAIKTRRAHRCRLSASAFVFPPSIMLNDDGKSCSLSALSRIDSFVIWQRTSVT